MFTRNSIGRRYSLYVFSVLTITANIYFNYGTIQRYGSLYSREQVAGGNNHTETRSIGKDWYDKVRFEKQFSNRCLVVDNLCHSSGRWWYKPLADGVDGNQPSFSFHTNLDGAVGYPEIVEVTSSSNSDYNAQMMSNFQCTVSPIINHISMYSYYNTMLGEFYNRVLKGLFEMSKTQAEDLTDFLQQTQLYLHMYDKNYQPMLNSHHIFTDAFRGHPLLDVKELLENSGCRCLQRLFLCGYSFSSSSGNVFNFSIRNQNILITPGDGIYAERPVDSGWKELRNALRHHIFAENIFMQQDVEQFRENVLRSKGVEKDFDEWKVIGLSQRGGRRRWNNQNEIEHECNLIFKQYKIICTEINVETQEFRPYYHAVAHGGLDALFGIHGAQLTEALWMKPGSLVVEFLPWVHEDMMQGGWTRTVQEPTPLGVIFSGTDLNHIGFPLTRHSAPYCYGLGKEEEINCWRDNRWDDRNFVAPTISVIDSVATFFVNATANPSCDLYENWAAESFVLYNVQCIASDSNNVASNHFPWEKRLEDNPRYANYSNDLPK